VSAKAQKRQDAAMNLLDPERIRPRSLIDTPLQWGGRGQAEGRNRFNGFSVNGSAQSQAGVLENR
jgi:hypothetical protein